jgi:hypothetical protein
VKKLNSTHMHSNATQMLPFQDLVSKETLSTFDLDFSEWTAEDQALLEETMILKCKDEPEMSDYESKHACREEALRILLKKFGEEYGALVYQVDSWMGMKEAYAKRVKLGRKAFHKFLAERLEFKEFTRRFYDDLREMYNIDEVGMHDEFKKMKEKDWDYGVYTEHLKQQKKKMSKRR